MSDWIGQCLDLVCPEVAHEEGHPHTLPPTAPARPVPKMCRDMSCFDLVHEPGHPHTVMPLRPPAAVEGTIEAPPARPDPVVDVAGTQERLDAGTQLFYALYHLPVDLLLPLLDRAGFLKAYQRAADAFNAGKPAATDDAGAPLPVQHGGGPLYPGRGDEWKNSANAG